MLVLISLLSCKRTERRSIERFAVTPLENLTGDPSLDWAGAALSAAFATEIGASTHRVVLSADNTRHAAVEQASEVFQGYFDRRGGNLRFHAVLLNAATHRIVKEFDASGDVAAAADTFAHELGDRLRPPPTRSPDALRAWGEALATTDPNARAAALDRAITADPNFGAPYNELARLYHALGRRQEAAAVIERARPRLTSFSDVDRARLELFDAELAGDRNRQRQALVALSRLYTADADILRRLAELDTARRDFNSAAESYRAALAIRPDDPALLNAAGYAEAYRGNLDAARAALERYRSLQPDQWNPLDSLGEVHFFLGRFEDAGKYFLEGQKLAPGPTGALELVKAAQCRLLLGDLAGADAIFNRYLAALGQNPRAAILEAQWFYLTGRRTRAFAAMEKAAAAPNPPLASYAAGQVAVWYAIDGDRDRARAAAERCMRVAANSPLGIVCQTIANPQAPVPPQMQEIASLYRPLFARDFAAALPELKALFERTQPAADAGPRTLYAWALVETGRVAEAAPLVDRYPIPIGAGDLIFTGLEFPRFLALRAAVLRSQGKSAEADQAQALFQKLSGS